MRTPWLRLIAIGALVAAGVAARVSTRVQDVPAPVIETSVGGITCPAPARCLAVGLSGSRYTIRTPYGGRLVDGSWVANHPQAPSQTGDSLLSSIACPSPTHCVAVGSQEVPAPYFGARSAGDRPLIEVWNGASWRLQKAPIPPGTADAQLNGVSCTGPFCFAVGDYAGRSGNDRVLAQVWDGSRWMMRLPPKPRSMEDPILYDVACTSSTSCIGVGHFTYEVGAFFNSQIAPLILRWNGHGWHFELSANPGGSLDTELGAISCAAPNRCVAVGSDRVSGGTYSTFAEINNDGAWKTLPTPDPAGSPDAEFMDVSCPLPDRCFAVGFFALGSDSRPLLESWDGTKWTIQPTSMPPGASAGVLTAIDCVSARTCEVVGTYRQGTPTQHAFSATLDERRWDVVPMPDPDGNA